ncbi:MAG: OsmC family protein [Rhodothermales bacterium]
MADIRVHLARQEQPYHFKATNAAGHVVDIDDATAYEDGKGNGVGPMQLLMMAIGGCSGVDVVSILEKSRQDIRTLEIDVHGHKPDGTSPSLYDHVHVHFRLTGELDEVKVRRAVDLSLGKYCSVAKTLEKSASIAWSFEINGTPYDGGSSNPVETP